MSLAPVIYIFFNRPAAMRRSLAAIRAARPPRLHLIADGPRTHKPNEAQLCTEARALVENAIDWPCEVSRDYSDVNLGCGRRVSSGLTRAFALLGEAMVIEDDTAPHADFFPFCTAQLAAFRHDPGVHAVCGFNPLNRYQPGRGPAVCSLYNNIWGWASWQRSWGDYTYDVSEWSDPAVQRAAREFLDNDLLYEFYRQGLDQTVAGHVDSWDFQWSYTLLKHRRRVVMTTVNFIENLGFGADATHTHARPAWVDGVKTSAAIAAPQRHDLSKPDRRHDRLYAFVMSSDRPAKVAAARVLARSPLLSRWFGP